MNILKRGLLNCLTAVALFLVGFFANTTVNAGETITYFHNDVSGTPMVATDASGNVAWKENYRPYGDKLNNQAASSNNKLWFAGKPYDGNTGLSYMGARYYDPMLGRFVGIDPQGFDPGNIHSFNRYAYANNNPYKFVDPDGHSPIDVAFLIYDLGKLGVAAYTGDGRGHALGDVALSVVGVVSPIPAAGEALKAARAVEHAVEAGRATEKAVEGVKGANEVANTAAKARNKPPGALAEAEGRPHSIIERSGKDGQYTTHNGDGTWKQYRGSGQEHGGIPRPNVKETGKNVTPDGREFIDKGRVRPAGSNEIPGG